jgi:hypothetical protein
MYMESQANSPYFEELPNLNSKNEDIAAPARSGGKSWISGMCNDSTADQTVTSGGTICENKHSRTHQHDVHLE